MDIFVLLSIAILAVFVLWKSGVLHSVKRTTEVVTTVAEKQLNHYAKVQDGEIMIAQGELDSKLSDETLQRALSFQAKIEAFNNASSLKPTKAAEVSE